MLLVLKILTFGTQSILVLSSKYLWLIHKKELLADFVDKNSIDIIGITEILLNDSIPSTFVGMEGHYFERRDRRAPGGGIGVFIKSDIHYARR